MAWIELHQSVFRHPKTLRLATALSRPRVHIVGHLAALWAWALDAMPDGGPMTEAELKHGSEWGGPVSKWVEALLTSRYIEKRADGYWLHDWDDYAGKLLSKRAANKERMRVARALHVPPTTGARAGATQPTQPTLPSVPSERPALTPTERFFKTDKTNERVAALVDIATANGRDLDGGHTAAMLRKHPPPDVLKALMTAIGENAARLDTRMEGVLRNANGRTGQGGRGNARRGTQRVVTREEVLRDADKF